MKVKYSLRYGGDSYSEEGEFLKHFLFNQREFIVVQGYSPMRRIVVPTEDTNYISRINLTKPLEDYL